MMTRRAPNTSRGHGRGQLSQAGRRQQVSIKRRSRIYPVCRPAGLKAPLGRAPPMKRQRRLSASYAVSNCPRRLIPTRACSRRWPFKGRSAPVAALLRIALSVALCRSPVYYESYDSIRAETESGPRPDRMIYTMNHTIGSESGPRSDRMIYTMNHTIRSESGPRTPIV